MLYSDPALGGNALSEMLARISGALDRRAQLALAFRQKEKCAWARFTSGDS